MLYLWMPEGEGAWRWCNASGAAEGLWQTAQTWNELLQETTLEKSSQACVFFPSSALQISRHALSRQQVKQLGQNGVRYLLEDYALAPVETLTVRAWQSGPEELSVIGVPQGQIDIWLNALGLAPWQVMALLPDFLLIPLDTTHPEIPTLYWSAHQQLWRGDEAYGLAVDDLALSLSRLPLPTNLNVVGVLDETAQQALAAHNIVWETVNWPLQPPKQLQRHPFNVLAPTRQRTISPYWRAAAVVLLSLLLARMAYDGISGYYYTKEAKATRAQSVRQFRAWFPEEGRIVNLRRQVEAHRVAPVAAEPVVLKLISQVGPAVSQANVKLRELTFNGQALELTLDAPNLPSLDSLRGQLVSQGIKAELGSVNPAGSQVSGTLRVLP